jgi:hypothetical protein
MNYETKFIKIDLVTNAMHGLHVQIFQSAELIVSLFGTLFFGSNFVFVSKYALDVYLRQNLHFLLQNVLWLKEAK